MLATRPLLGADGLAMPRWSGACRSCRCADLPPLQRLHPLLQLSVFRPQLHIPIEREQRFRLMMNAVPIDPEHRPCLDGQGRASGGSEPRERARSSLLRFRHTASRVVLSEDFHHRLSPAFNDRLVNLRTANRRQAPAPFPARLDHRHSPPRFRGPAGCLDSSCRSFKVRVLSSGAG